MLILRAYGARRGALRVAHGYACGPHPWTRLSSLPLYGGLPERLGAAWPIPGWVPDDHRRAPGTLVAVQVYEYGEVVSHLTGHSLWAASAFKAPRDGQRTERSPASRITAIDVHVTATFGQELAPETLSACSDRGCCAKWPLTATRCQRSWSAVTGAKRG
jgi:hypothetical protein